MVVTRHQGKTYLTVRGPESRASVADCPADGEWVGILFKVGTFMPLLPTGMLRDRNDVTLADASANSFWLNGSAWDFPTFENADTFVQRLAKRDLVVMDAGIETALHGRPNGHSQRTEQRHFRRATGLTRATARQIERARHATNLLQSGTAILQVVHEAGYYDQAHMTRSLRHFVGQTPLQISCGHGQLSLLYKTGES